MTDPSAPRPAGSPAPGWYADDQGQVRWWDGSGWTEHLQESAQAQPEPEVVPEQPGSQSPEAPETPSTAPAPPTPLDPSASAQPVPAQPPDGSEAPTPGIVPDPFSAGGAGGQPGLSGQAAAASASPQAPDFPLAPGYMPPPAAEPTGSSGGPNYLPWIVALVSVVALCIAAVLIVSSLGGEEDAKETDALPSGDVSQVQSGLRTAQTAIETYAVDNNGSYQGATPDDLAAVDGTISQIPLTVSGTASGYVLSASAGETSFSITRAEGGVVTFACTPPGGEGCDESGSWGLGGLGD